MAAPQSNRKSTLFIGDLASICTEKDIHDVFSPFGKITEIKIMRSDDNNRSLSYGFVRFSQPAAAQLALTALDGSLLCGRNLRLGWASYRSKNEPKLLQHHDRIDSSSVHVSYISYQVNTKVTEESLRIMFSAFGVVLDTSIKKSYIDENTQRQCGYGFIHYAKSVAGVESALAAVAALHDTTVDGISYKCSVSHDLEKHLLGIPKPKDALQKMGLSLSTNQSDSANAFNNFLERKRNSSQGARLIPIPHPSIQGTSSNVDNASTRFEATSQVSAQQSNSSLDPNSAAYIASLYRQASNQSTSKAFYEEFMGNRNSGSPPTALDSFNKLDLSNSSIYRFPSTDYASSLNKGKYIPSSVFDTHEANIVPPGLNRSREILYNADTPPLYPSFAQFQANSKLNSSPPEQLNSSKTSSPTAALSELRQNSCLVMPPKSQQYHHPATLDNNYSSVDSHFKPQMRPSTHELSNYSNNFNQQMGLIQESDVANTFDLHPQASRSNSVNRNPLTYGGDGSQVNSRNPSLCHSRSSSHSESFDFSHNFNSLDGYEKMPDPIFPFPPTAYSHQNHDHHQSTSNQGLDSLFERILSLDLESKLDQEGDYILKITDETNHN